MRSPMGYAMRMADTTYYTPKVVLAVGAHADDIDITCGGSLARWVAEGAEVYYLLLTDSSCGSDDETMTREQLIMLHKSQFGEDRERMAGMLGSRSEKLGTKIGAKYAEGFMRIDVKF
jgi:hypothetical protein